MFVALGKLFTEYLLERGDFHFYLVAVFGGGG